MARTGSGLSHGVPVIWSIGRALVAVGSVALLLGSSAGSVPSPSLPVLLLTAPFQGHQGPSFKSFSNGCGNHRVIVPPSFDKTSGNGSVAVEAIADGSSCPGRAVFSYITIEPAFTTKSISGIGGHRQIVATWNLTGLMNLTTVGNNSWAKVQVWVGYLIVADVSNGTLFCFGACAGTGRYSDYNYPCIAEYAIAFSGSSVNSTLKLSARAFVNMTMNRTHQYEIRFSLLYYVDAYASGPARSANALLWLAPPYGCAKLSSVAVY